MLDLAIADDIGPKGETIVLSNHGHRMIAHDWPQDCDFQIVAFSSSARSCKVIWSEELAVDIGRALKALDDAQAVTGKKPGWYRRLMRCAQTSEGSDS